MISSEAAMTGSRRRRVLAALMAGSLVFLASVQLALPGAVHASSLLVKVPVGPAYADPQGVAVDADGTMYIADTAGNRVLKVTTSGVQTTVTSDVYHPMGVAVDSTGTVYVADTGLSRVDAVTSAGVQSSITISGGFNYPYGVAVDSNDVLHVADTGHNRVVSVDGGTVTPIGSGLSAPRAVAIDSSGTVFIADSGNNRVVSVDTAAVQTELGSGFSTPSSVAVDSAGAVYVADFDNNRAVKVVGGTNAGTVGQSFVYPTAVAVGPQGDIFVAASDHIGGGTEILTITSANVQTVAFATFYQPIAVAIDPSNNIFVADSGHHRVARIDAVTGVVSTIASGLPAVRSLATDSQGNVYVGQSGGLHSDQLLRIDTSGAQTYVGSGFYSVTGIAIDRSDNIYVADYNAGHITKIAAADGAMTSIGSGFIWLNGVAVDSQGTVYVAEGYQVTPPGCPGPYGPCGSIFAVTSGGVQSKFATGFVMPCCLNQFSVAVNSADVVYGVATPMGEIDVFDSSGNPTVIAGDLAGPYGMAFDSTDTPYVADFNHNRVVKLVPKPVPTITTNPTASPITYGQTLASSNLTGGSASVSGTFTFTTPATVPSAGSAPQSVTFTPNDTTTYNPVSFEMSVEVNKAASTTVVTCPASLPYTGTPLTPCSVAVTGAGGLSLTPTPVYANNTAVGTNTASASYAYPGDANYEGSSDVKYFSITSTVAALYVVPDPKSVAYGSSVPRYTFTLHTGSPTGPIANPVSRDGTVEAPEPKAPKCTSSYTYSTPVGSSPLTITCSGGTLTGYAFDTSSIAALTIIKAPSTTTVTCPSSVAYTGSALTPCTATVRGAGGLSSTATVNYLSNTNVGTASASAMYAGDANHNTSGGSKAFTISTAATALTYTGARMVIIPATLALSATRTPAACTGTVMYSLDRNPLTGKAGSYLLTGTSPATPSWREGTYSVSSALAASSNCKAATTVSKIAVNQPRQGR